MVKFQLILPKKLWKKERGNTMKKLALILGLGLMFAACGDEVKKDSPTAPATQEQDKKDSAEANKPAEQGATEAASQSNTEAKPEAQDAQANQSQPQADGEQKEKAQ